MRDKFSKLQTAYITTLVVALTRLGVLVTGKLGLVSYNYVGDLRWHHAHTGVALLVVSLVARKWKKTSALLFALGLGLVVDEPNVVLSWFGAPLFPYWHPTTMLSVVVLLCLVWLWDLRHPEP